MPQFSVYNKNIMNRYSTLCNRKKQFLTSSDNIIVTNSLQNSDKRRVKFILLKQIKSILSICRELDLLLQNSSYDLQVSLVGVKRMRTLNKFYRNIDHTTDVLSFENAVPLHFPRVNLGALYLCDPVVCRQAKEQGHSFDDECLVLLTHGVLHLLGYDHEKSPVQARKMRGLESQILSAIQKNKKSSPRGLIERSSK